MLETCPVCFQQLIKVEETRNSFKQYFCQRQFHYRYCVNNFKEIFIYDPQDLNYRKRAFYIVQRFPNKNQYCKIFDPKLEYPFSDAFDLDQATLLNILDFDNLNIKTSYNKLLNILTFI